MNSSYKIALAVAAALCLVILGYYVTQSADDTVTADDAATDNVAESAGPGETTTTRPSLAQTAATRPSSNTGSLRPPPRSDSKIAASPTPPAASPQSSSPPTDSRPTLRDMVAAANASDTTNEEDQTVSVAPPPSSIPPSPTPEPRVAPTDGTLSPVATGGANTALSTETVDPVEGDRSVRMTAANPPPPINPLPPAAVATTTPAAVRPATAEPPLTYVVEPGDTFAAIAEKVYGDERFWVDIAQANPTIDPKRLKIDQVLQMPPAKDLVSPSPESTASDRAGEVRYTVRPGDSLSSIAQQYYGDPNAWRIIFNANREAMGNNPDAIEAGKILVVPPAPTGAE